MSVVFLLGNYGFRLAILWDGSIPMHSSDLTHGFQFCAGLMHLSCVHTAGIKGGVVQDRGNSVKQLQTSEIPAFTILVLCSVTSWYLGLSTFFERLLCRTTNVCKALQDSWKASMIASLCVEISNTPLILNFMCSFGIKYHVPGGIGNPSIVS